MQTNYNYCIVKTLVVKSVVNWYLKWFWQRKLWRIECVSRKKSEKLADKTFGELLINCQIHQGFLLPKFFIIQ